MRRIPLALLCVSMSAFAGGSEVDNPWPLVTAEEKYVNSVHSIESILKSQIVAQILSKQGSITSIQQSHDGYLIKTAACSLAVELNYDSPAPWARVRVLETNCIK